MIEDSQNAFRHMPEHGLSLFLAKRTKTVHMVRHAEGLHNVAIKEAGSEAPTIFSTPGSDVFLDARLTSEGRRQCHRVREAISDLGSIDLVVVSPLTRTLQTAHEIFGGQGHPFLVHDLCRERHGLYMNDKRRTRSEIISEFSSIFASTGDIIDFDSFGYANEDDIDWQESREPSQKCEQRAIEFLQWLASRRESNIAVVTHSSFLRHLFGQFGCGLSTLDRTALQRAVGNVEIRSVTLAAHRKLINDAISPTSKLEFETI